jgi:WD40 repeat protein
MKLTHELKLPDEILYAIFHYLDLPAIFSCYRTCSRWCSIIDSDIARHDLWFCQFRFQLYKNKSLDTNEPFYDNLLAESNTNIDWKKEAAIYVPIRKNTHVIQTEKIHTDEIWHAAWSHSGDKLVTSGKDGTANFYDLVFAQDSWQLRWSASYQSDNGHAFGYATWSHDDTQVLLSQSGSLSDQPTRTILYDVQKQIEVAKLPCNPFDMFGMWFEGKVVIGSGCVPTQQEYVQRIQILDVKELTTQVLYLSFPKRHANYAHCMHLSSRGNMATYITGDSYHITNQIQIIRNFASLKDSQNINTTTLETITVAGNCQGTHLSDDGKLYVNVRPLANTDDESEDEDFFVGPELKQEFQLHEFDLNDLSKTPHVFTCHKSFGVFLAYPHVMGKLVTSGSEDGRVIMWHRDYGLQIGDWKEHDVHVSIVAMNPVHQHLFVSVSDDFSLKLWSTVK